MSEEKTVSKKAPAKKAAAKKVEAKKVEAAPSRFEELKSKFEEARNKSQENSKRFGLAYAGMLATAYDLAAERLESVKQSGNDNIEKFVSRGEQLNKDAQAKVEELNLPKDLDGVKAKFEELDLPKDFDAVKEKFNEVVEDTKAKIMPAKDAA